jgi:hypothetical protein
MYRRKVKELLSKKIFAVLFFMLIISSLVTIRTNAWSNGGYSNDPLNPDYGTHDWIAQHALDWLPSDEKAYLENNLAGYLYGTELPDNGLASDGIGDTTEHHIYYFSNGTLQDDSSAVRALEEYNLALSFLNTNDFVNASKHVGIMAHYIVDVAVFGHVMGTSTEWGAEQHHSDYESYVNTRTNSYEDDFNSYLSYTGSLDTITAYDAVLNLAYDTTFDLNGDFTCVWMDQNYDWNNPLFKDRCGESLNLAVNYLVDVIHTLDLSRIQNGRVNHDDGENHVVINEIELNPSGNDTGLNVEEWVELYNPSKSSVNIGGWNLSSTHGTIVTITIPQGVTLGAKDYYVCKRGALWLDNEDESVVLRDSEAIEVDRSIQISDGENDGKSWQRYPNSLDTDSISDWSFRLSTEVSSNGGTGTIGDLTTIWRNAVLVTGTDEPYGPLLWGALGDDTVGANDLTSALYSYGNPSSTSDVNVTEWSGGIFFWKLGSSTSLIAIGGTAVNIVSYHYNSLIHFDLNVAGKKMTLLKSMPFLTLLTINTYFSLWVCVQKAPSEPVDTSQIILIPSLSRQQIQKASFYIGTILMEIE